MSWSVGACGPAAKVAEQLEQQFTKIHCNDPGEQATVDNTRTLVVQTLATFEADKPVRVVASGSLGFKNWDKKEGAFQSVDLKIEPIHFNV